jgi:sec-independent protein translocase protein TatA
MSLWHWIIVLAVVLLLFGGRGKVSQLMGDFGKGLQAFKKGVGSQDESAQANQGQPGDQAKQISGEATTSSPGGKVHQDTAAKV